MKVYDYCPFFSSAENDLYEIRINEHWDCVDKFIIIESGETHTGFKKRPNFDHERFRKYAEKLLYVHFDTFKEEMAKYPTLIDHKINKTREGTPAEHDWARDNFQGNYIVKVLEDLDADNEDIVYGSSLDEIISTKSLGKAIKIVGNNRSELFKAKTSEGHDKNGLHITKWGEYNDLHIPPLMGFWLKTYAYKLNLLCPTVIPMANITTYGALKTILPATLRHLAIYTHDAIGSFHNPAGWHFTCYDNTPFGGGVYQKYSSWAHSKDDINFCRDLPKCCVHHFREEVAIRVFQEFSLEVVKVKRKTHPNFLLDNIDMFSRGLWNPLGVDGKIDREEAKRRMAGLPPSQTTVSCGPSGTEGISSAFAEHGPVIENGRWKEQHLG